MVKVINKRYRKLEYSVKLPFSKKNNIKDITNSNDNSSNEEQIVNETVKKTKIKNNTPKKNIVDNE